MITISTTYHLPNCIFILQVQVVSNRTPYKLVMVLASKTTWVPVVHRDIRSMCMTSTRTLKKRTGTVQQSRIKQTGTSRFVAITSTKRRIVEWGTMELRKPTSMSTTLVVPGDRPAGSGFRRPGTALQTSVIALFLWKSQITWRCGIIVCQVRFVT